MSLYTILLGIQYASVFLMLLECAYITKKWTSPLHGWLFFYCFSTFINNAGYLAYLQAETENEAIFARQLMYAGRPWIPFALLMFILILCTGKRFSVITTPLSILHGLSYLAVLFVQHTDIYYVSYRFVNDGLFAHLLFKNGILHYVLDILILSYIPVCLFLLFRTMRHQVNRRKKKQLAFIIAAVISDIVFFIPGMLRLIPEYDMDTLGFTVASIFLFIAIFVYDFMEAKFLAHDFIMENIAEGIVVTNEKGNMIVCNEKARKLLAPLAPTQDEAIMVMQELISKGKPLLANGRTFSIKEESMQNKKHVVGNVYLITDETEHYRYIAELKEQKLIADKANQAKGEFLSNMSHEIRSPINAVLGLDEMILRESEEKVIRGYATDIQSSGKMLLSIINDILDFSKIESGKMEIIPVDYDLSYLINDLVTMTAPRAEAKNLDFRLEIDETMPNLLVGDETRIKQCILNILTNAIKYTMEGSVTLSIGAEQTGEHLCALYISVKDTGIGIKEEDIKKLFSPFERIEEGRNRAIEGTGLGMSIVKRLLAAMGTKLEVESVYGKGSRFSFRIEQTVRDWKAIGNYEETRARGLEKEYEYREAFQAPDAKILVVDDTPVNLTVMKGLLKQTRIQIECAEDGIIALGKTKGQKYDIIFIDHRMPKMDGMEMLATLRADGENPNKESVCIALTANVTGDVRKEYIDAGFEDYLSKPVDPKKLETAIERYLSANLVLHEGDAGWQDGLKDRQRQEEAQSEGPAGLDMNKMLLDASAAFFKNRFGLDICAAMMNCGNEEVFQDVVKVFHETIDGKAADIERFASEGNWRDYTVQVHALKSSARLIGATELSNMAAELEALGNRARDGSDEEAVRSIRKDTPALLADYRSFRDRLAPLCTAGQGTEA